MKKDEFINLMDQHAYRKRKKSILKKNADYADRNGLNILANFERVAAES